MEMKGANPMTEDQRLAQYGADGRKVFNLIREYAKAQHLPHYCQRGDSPKRFAMDVIEGRPVPSWVREAMAQEVVA